MGFRARGGPRTEPGLGVERSQGAPSSRMILDSIRSQAKVHVRIVVESATETPASSHCDDPVDLLDGRHPFEDLVHRAALERAHAEIDSDPTEDVLGDLLKNQL